MSSNNLPQLAGGAPPVEARAWTPRQSETLYQINTWADDYFFVNEAGHVAVDPSRKKARGVDLHTVVRHLRAEGVQPPMLLRFQDVLHGRVKQLNEAFAQAIDEFGYANGYTTVYPIKVNQLHEVVEEVLDAGAPYGLGLECGSKAELVAALGHLDADDRLLVCNGYKDAEMLRLILRGQELGKCVIPVIEAYEEFEALLRLGRETGVRPCLGVRINLSATGVGQWAASSGDAAKFGVEIAELLKMLGRMEAEGLADRLDLLHCHVGSQITDIQALRRAVREITQVYVRLRKRGVPVSLLDVGGGLGVNYEAGYRDAERSVNYTLQEYANSVVGVVHEICAQADVPVPRLLSESGRAITAHHAVLVVEVIGVQRRGGLEGAAVSETDEHAVVGSLRQTLEWVGELGRDRPQDVSMQHLVEAYHDALEKREEANQRFDMGYLSLEEKARAEQLYWAIGRAIHERMVHVEEQRRPAELQQLEEQMVDQYLCAFSVFQSILDHWAIGQAFPIMPLHRLDEAPTRRAVLVDLTCDSDGKVSRYVSANGEKHFLEVHPVEREHPYYLGVFLTGAYQDIMGDVHNLFGRLPEVHIYADAEEPDGYYVEKVIPGDSVQEMLAHVQYFPNDLHRRMERIIREKVEQGRMRPKAGVELLNQYRSVFDKSTYFNPSER